MDETKDAKLEQVFEKSERDNNIIRKEKLQKRLKRWYEEGGKDKLRNKYKHNGERLNKLVEKYKDDDVFISALLKQVPKDKLVSLIL